MLPTAIENETVVNDFELNMAESMPTKTYFMDINKARVSNYVDGQSAMKQVIFKILQTERYQYSKIYSNNYGVEFIDLYGMPVAYCAVEIQRRITEALTWDERIKRVNKFTFDTSKKGVISVGFTAYTIFGTVDIDNVEVKI